MTGACGADCQRFCPIRLVRLVFGAPARLIRSLRRRRNWPRAIARLRAERSSVQKPPIRAARGLGAGRFDRDLYPLRQVPRPPKAPETGS